MKKLIIIMVFLMTLAIVAGCTTDNPFDMDEEQGNLVLSIVDAPDDAYTDVHINIMKIFVKPQGGEWLLLGDFTANPYAINLLDYRIQELILPATDVPAGAYEEIRIVLDTNGYIILASDPETQHPLTVGEVKDEDDEEEDDDDDVDKADDEQTIDVEYPFFITEEAITAIQVDFNVAEMIEPNEETGIGYVLNTDEVKALDKAKASEIEGKIMARVAEGEYTSLTDTLVTVTLYDAADTALATPLTSTWATWEAIEDEDEDDKEAEPGKFKVRGIPEGEYQLTIAAEGYELITITGLSCTDEEDIEIGEDKEEEVTYTITGGEIFEEFIVLLPVATN